MALDLPKLSPRAPIIGSGNRSFPAHPTFLEFLEKTRDALIAQEGTQDELIADLAQAILDIQTAQAAADAAQADADAAQADADTAQTTADGAVADAATAQAAANAADGRVDDVLDGTESHTALNVGGTDVKPLLDKSDGSEFDDVTAVEQGLLTPVNYAFTAGSVTWTASSTEQTVQTVSNVVVTRGAVRISGLVDIVVDVMTGASAYLNLKLYRDGVHQPNADRFLYCRGDTATWMPPPQGQLEYYDTPGPGTYDYDLKVAPSEVITGTVLRRSLACDPQEG